jgi:hypothetical protein
MAVCPRKLHRLLSPWKFEYIQQYIFLSTEGIVDCRSVEVFCGTITYFTFGRSVDCNAGTCCSWKGVPRGHLAVRVQMPYSHRYRRVTEAVRNGRCTSSNQIKWVDRWAPWSKVGTMLRTGTRRHLEKDGDGGRFSTQHLRSRADRGRFCQQATARECLVIEDQNNVCLWVWKLGQQ